MADDLIFFWPEEMVGRVTPPLIRFIHGTADPAVDLQKSQIFYEHAGEPKDPQLVKDHIHQLPSPKDNGEDKANEIANPCLEWFEKYLT